MMSQKHSFSERIWQIITNLSALPRDDERLAKKKRNQVSPKFSQVWWRSWRRRRIVSSPAQRTRCAASTRWSILFKISLFYILLLNFRVSTFTIPCNAVNAERVRPKGPRAKIQFFHAILRYQKKSSFDRNKMQKNMHTLLRRKSFRVDSQLDSVAVSIFLDILVEVYKYSVSDNNVLITTPIL